MLHARVDSVTTVWLENSLVPNQTRLCGGSTNVPLEVINSN